jgi:ABC-2 type transport system ATP-binding protein
LDEPTIGLDVLVKERIRGFLKAQNKQNGTTVLLTTHDLGDIEELCSRVLIIDAGKLIYDGALETIKQRFGTHRTMKFELAGEWARQAPPLRFMDGVEIISQEGASLELKFDRALCSASQVASSVMSQLEVLDFSIGEPDLTSIVKQIYAGGLS